MTVKETEPGTRWTATTPAGATASAWIGRLHTTHAWLDAEESVSATDLREFADALVTAAGVPVAAKAEPGTPRHTWLTEAGATAYQIVPPSEINLTDPDNLAWARCPVPADGLVSDLAGLSAETLLEMWVDVYEWVHQEWSLVADRQAAGEILRADARRGTRPGTQRAGAPRRSAQRAWVCLPGG